MVIKPKPCKWCKGTNHQSFQCRLRPRKPPKPKVRKPLKRSGPIKVKLDEEWERTKAEWFEENPPDHSGYYYCRLDPCFFPGSPMTKSETRLDHELPKGKFPKLKYDKKNLRPAHDYCNSVKGSLMPEAYKIKALRMIAVENRT